MRVAGAAGPPEEAATALALCLSLCLGRAPPSDEVGGRNINSNSCFLTPAVSLPANAFLESPCSETKREFSGAEEPGDPGAAARGGAARRGAGLGWAVLRRAGAK